jgi:glycosyltransferase involved in cell wall biosynthesis
VSASPQASTARSARASGTAPRRILFVEASIGGVVGGSLTGILHLIDRMDRERFEPALLLYETKVGMERYERAGVPVHVLPPLPVPTPDGGRGLLGRAWLRAADLWQVTAPRARAVGEVLVRERPDILYLANGLTANIDGVLAGARAGLPMICHEKGYRRVGPVERFLSRWVDACVGMTEDVTRHYQAHRVRARRFRTIYDGIDCAQFQPGGGVAVRTEFGIPAGAPVCGIVGHIQDWKGQLLVAEAVAKVRMRFPELYCLMVGGVHRQGAAYGAMLEKRIAQPDLAGHVILTGARQDVAACLDAMDVAIHSSTRPEPFGRVMIEAMALGCPLVAPREGGPVVIIADGETGFLVAPRDSNALAEGIEKLVADPALRARMGRAARERLDQVFDIRHHVRIMQELFDELLADRQGARRLGS